LDVTVTSEARDRILAFLHSITEYTPTLSLLKRRTNDESEERWGYGAYAPKNIEVLAPELERRGHALLYSFDSLVAAIPQFHLLPEITGQTIGMGRRGLVILPREPGI